MKSSKNLNGESGASKKLSRGIRIGQEVLVTNLTSELVEFYWSNQKRFSGSYIGFPVEVQ